MTMLSSQSTEQEKKQFNVNAKVNIEVCKNEQRLRLKHTYTHTTRKFIKRNDVTDFAFLYFTCAVVRRVSFRLAWFFFRICTFCVELNEKNEALYSYFHLRRKSFQSVAGKDQRRQKKINRAITTWGVLVRARTKHNFSFTLYSKRVCIVHEMSSSLPLTSSRFNRFVYSGLCIFATMSVDENCGAKERKRRLKSSDTKWIRWVREFKRIFFFFCSFVFLCRNDVGIEFQSRQQRQAVKWRAKCSSSWLMGNMCCTLLCLFRNRDIIKMWRRTKKIGMKSRKRVNCVNRALGTSSTSATEAKRTRTAKFVRCQEWKI